MLEGAFSYFDITVLAIMGLSCLFAFFRGFVKEILSLGAWIGAGLITIYYFPDAAKALEPRFKSPIVASGVATLAIYITALLFFSLINALILRFMKEGEEVGALDNTLGLMFGALRGAFVICLGYLMVTMVMTEEEYPKWMKEARTRPLVEEGAIVLAKAAPDYLRELSSLHERMGGTKSGEKKALWPEKPKQDTPMNAVPQGEAAPAR